MSKPIVAVVGRPNVGKSTLFNKIVGSRVSIVEDTPGVTRDRIYAEAEWSGVPFVLIDTGGIEPDSDDIILSQMREQAQIAIEMCIRDRYISRPQEAVRDRFSIRICFRKRSLPSMTEMSSATLSYSAATTACGPVQNSTD